MEISRTPTVRAITLAGALGAATLTVSMRTAGATSASKPMATAVTPVIVSSVVRVMPPECRPSPAPGNYLSK